MSTRPDPPELKEILAEPAFRAVLARFVGARAPAGEVDDIVQSTLADALAAKRVPEGEEQMRRWVFGIARHKVADFFRRSGREGPTSSPLGDEVVAESAPLSARELLRWAERELPDGEHSESTLEWMMREAGGDKLERIADEEKIPAPRVRQRVARMRKHFRERWALHAAIGAALLLTVAALAYLSRRPAGVDIAREVPSAVPTEQQRGAELRRAAFAECDKKRYRSCLAKLDEAKRLDPAGDLAPGVKAVRRAAAEALEPKRAPAPAPTQSAVEPAPSQAPTAPTPPIKYKKAPPAKAKPKSDKAMPLPLDFGSDKFEK